MKLNLAFALLLSLANFTAYPMDPIFQGKNSDDEIPTEMLSSWIIISKLGQQLAHNPPVITDLQKLCKAANQCTQNIHNQLAPVFRACKLPLSTHQEPQEFVVIYDQSPVNEFLKTLQLIGPVDDTRPSPVIEDYQPLLQAACTIEVATRQFSAPRKESPAVLAPLITLPREQSSSIKQLFSTAIAYPLHPFAAVFAFMRKQTQPQEPLKLVKMDVESSCAQDQSRSPSTTCMFDIQQPEEDPRMVNHEKYQKVLAHGKKLLKEIVINDEQARKLLAQLKEQLVTLQETITRNIEYIEFDRASFNNMQQCVCTQDMTLNDNLLLQYCKMGQYNATIERALVDFKLNGRKITDVTQEQFEARWQTIQELHRTGRMNPETYNQMRQYSYILQNVTSRHLAQAFLDGTINKYGMNPETALKRGLTAERIDHLTSELSNCKSFLMQLNKAFADSLKVIDKAMEE